MMISPVSTLGVILFFFLCVVGVTSADDGPGADDAMPNMPGFGDKPCPNFRCTAGYTPVHKSRAKFVSKGCSKMGGGMMMMAGGGGGDEKYASCCDQWHACYQTCGASKKSCDDGFKACGAKTCAGDEECKKGYEMNAMLLGMGGCGLYDQGQYASCECVKTSKAEEKRASALRSFYKKYAPENVSKTDALAKKVDTTAKLAGLFRKLVVKYPESIKVEIDDEMAKMQEMMNQAKENKDGEDGGEAVNMDDEL